MKYRKILLTQDKIALVDIEDYKYLNQFKWCAVKDNKNGFFYAARKGKKSLLRMHRVIMNNPKNMHIDHINSNSLDNRRKNLRICFRAQNQMNRGKQLNNTSGYKGVYWNKVWNKWLSAINIKKKQKHLGYFPTKEKAALAYNEAAKKYHGDFARLNIIR